MVLLESSNIMRHNNQETVDVIQYEEYDMPLKNMQALKRLEELLRDRSFANKMVKMLYNIILLYINCKCCNFDYPGGRINTRILGFFRYTRISFFGILPNTRVSVSFRYHSNILT